MGADQARALLGPDYDLTTSFGENDRTADAIRVLTVEGIELLRWTIADEKATREAGGIVLI